MSQPSDVLTASNHSQPLVSVLMPAYNCAKLIGESIESVLNQSYQNWELIIIDDMSPDNTVEVVQQYLGDPRVKLKCADTRGGTAGMGINRALEIATGELVAFLGCDDLFEPDALRTLVQYMNQNPECFCSYGLFREIDMQSRFLEKSSDQHWNDLRADHWKMDYKALHTWENIVLQRIPLMLQSCLIRRSVMDELKPVRSDMLWEDYLCYLKLFTYNRDGIHRIAQPVFRYRFNVAGLSKSTEYFKKLLQKVPATVDAIQDMGVYLLDKRFTTSYLSAKMYSDVAWLRFRGGLYRETIFSTWVAFCDTRVRLADWWTFCAGMFFKSFIPSPLWKTLRAVKNLVSPRSIPAPVR